MLDLFSSKQTLATTEGGNGGSMRTIAVRVDRYDLSNNEEPLCIGTDLATDEEVAVTLRKPKTARANEERYTSIFSLAGKVNSMINRWVRKNGVVVFSNCYQDANTGNWKAGFVTTLSHGDPLPDNEMLDVVKRTGSAPTVDSGFAYLHTQAAFFCSVKDGKPYAGVTLALLNDKHFTDDLSEPVKAILGYKQKGKDIAICAKTYTDFDKMKNYIEFLLGRQFGVIVRVKAEQNGDIAFRTYVGDKGVTYKTLMGELDTPENRAGFQPMLDSGALVIEVIPTLTVFASKNYLERLFQNGTTIPSTTLNILNGSFRLPTTGEKFKRLNTLAHVGLNLISKGYNEQRELVDLKEPFLQLKFIETEYDADRYVGFSTAAFYMKTDAIALENPDWVIENKTTANLSEIKFSADSIRNANGVSPNTDEDQKQSTQDALSQVSATNNTESEAKVTNTEPSFIVDDNDIPF